MAGPMNNLYAQVSIFSKHQEFSTGLSEELVELMEGIEQTETLLLEEEVDGMDGIEETLMIEEELDLMVGIEETSCEEYEYLLLSLGSLDLGNEMELDDSEYI